MIAGAAALAFAGWRGERPKRQRAWEMDAGARRAAAEGAGRMAAGAHFVAVLHGEGADTVVVRLPGVRVRRGTDVVLEPEVFPARGAVALTRGGQCAIDSRGRLFDVSSAAAASAYAPCLQEREPPADRDPPRVPDGVTNLVEVALSSEIGCAREQTGTVRCWGPILRDRGVIRRDLPVTLAHVDDVQRLVTFGERICALQHGSMLCWGGAARQLGGDAQSRLPQPWTIAQGVTEIASLAGPGLDANGPLCALHADGAVRCWDSGPAVTAPRELRHEAMALHSLVGASPYLCALDDRSRAWCAWAAIVADATFVRAPAFDGFERIVNSVGRHFPLRGGALSCDYPGIYGPFIKHDHDATDEWVRVECAEAARRLPRTIPVPGALAQSTTPSVLRSGEVGAAQQAAFRDVLGSGVAASARSGHYQWCELGVNRRVACQWIPVDELDGPWDVDPHEALTADEPVRLIPGLDDAVELAVTTYGLACARRSTGAVVCWGRNGGGALTAAESARAPSSYTVEELLARVPSR